MTKRQKTAPTYPQVSVDLSGSDGNAYSIIARVSSAMRRHRVPADEILRFQDEARSGDYDNVIQTAMRWVDVE